MELSTCTADPHLHAGGMAMLERIVNTFLQDAEEGECQCLINVVDNSFAVVSYGQIKVVGSIQGNVI